MTNIGVSNDNQLANFLEYYKIPFEKWIKLESDNPDYPCINLDTEEKLNSFKIIGILKSKIKLY